MTKPASQTRERIQDVARELFGEKGVRGTSLQDIAGRLGMSKPALYHHFRSREDLVRSILQPLVDEGERYVVDQENRFKEDRLAPQQLLEGYFDFHFEHRAALAVALGELTTLADLDLIDKLLSWCTRLVNLVYGPHPTLNQSTRGVLAFGGVQDCCMQFPEAPYDDLRTATVAAALSALGLQP